ncbi:glycosyl hydrolase family 43 [Flavobacterium akiainvivens]|uniref:Glycosyl hydrolase family 43 n=1 Tax=Flavobacterium akiainvivens TaxID=1202724 RepID=A0A0M8MC28_9FLAO|nr:family 43 glycosylhydrolase [Flavobacterium akiainvivens]KOS05634.1 glycosyl hydrolase family 43 [Flavobacterium akiainvivens]SFQ35758.1 Glycosyl hydrolases family 43 [Flavobacterium akiainvivens]
MNNKLYILFLLACLSLSAQTKGKYSAIYSGSPWFDNRGQVVSAHGACIVKDGNTYYLFGEKHKDKDNAFDGFTCYSSKDLYNWKFESIALPVQPTGKLGPSRVGERVKVMQCPKTKEYVMYMHADSLNYKDQFTGYAMAKKITGPYEFKGPLLFNGQPIKKWDMGTFQDKDGSGYVLLHGGDIYRLADDYKSITEHVNKAFEAGFESPAILRKGDMYYFLGSHLTSWERNDNYYYTATSLHGPWTHRGLFAPENSLTWNSQTTFVLPVEGSKGTTYMFMGDRWAYPNQASSATYVWQPLTVEGTQLSIPQFKDVWQVDLKTGQVTEVKTGREIENTDKQIMYKGNWHNTAKNGTESRSDVKDDSFTFTFTGTRVGFYSLAGPDGGHARVLLQNQKGETVCTALLDTYSKYEVSSLKFISPELPKGQYTLTVTVVGERGNWSDKKKNNYGSTGNFVSVDKVVVQ